MSGHHKFSQLTEQFSEDRKVEIARKKSQIKATMNLTSEEKKKQCLTEGDKKIDTLDEMTELDDAFLGNKKAVKAIPKTTVSIPLDKDVLEWFENQETSYPVLINSVLRSYINTQQNKID